MDPVRLRANRRAPVDFTHRMANPARRRVFTKTVDLLRELAGLVGVRFDEPYDAERILVIAGKLEGVLRMLLRGSVGENQVVLCKAVSDVIENDDFFLFNLNDDESFEGGIFDLPYHLRNACTLLAFLGEFQYKYEGNNQADYLANVFTTPNGFIKEADMSWFATYVMFASGGIDVWRSPRRIKQVIDKVGVYHVLTHAALLPSEEERNFILATVCGFEMMQYVLLLTGRRIIPDLIPGEPDRILELATRAKAILEERGLDLFWREKIDKIVEPLT